MKELYDEIKNNYCDEKITDEYINKLACEKSNKVESYLPVVHQEKKKGIFADIKAQIAFYKLENKKLEDLIVKARGKMQFETFSSKEYTVIVPNKNKLDKVKA